jgi:hypothetical protein
MYKILQQSCFFFLVAIFFPFILEACENVYRIVENSMIVCVGAMCVIVDLFLYH